MPKRWFCLFLYFIFLSGLQLHALAQRGIKPEDYYSFQFLSDPHISPDGKTVAYVLTTIDQKKNRREASVWLATLDGSLGPRRLTAEGFRSTAPRWSPDGKSLAFISARTIEPPAASGRSPEAPSGETARGQIYLLPMSGGEAVALTKLKNGVENFQWSPDSGRIVLVSTSGPLDEVAPADRKSDVRHYKHINYKFNDTGWFDEKRRHLWIVSTSDGTAKQLTDGADWNDLDPQWSPDGQRIAFVSDRTGKAYDDGHNTDIWVIPAAGGTLTKISDHDFEDQSPRWSPDGKQILFTGKTALHQFAKLYVAGSGGGQPSQLVVKNMDLLATELQWPDSGSAFFASGIKGETHILRLNFAAHEFAPVTSGPRGIAGFDVNAKAGKIVYVANDFQHLNDLYVANLDGSGERQLTHQNQDLWKRLDPQPVERMPYTSTDGRAIDGFFVKPLGWQAGKKYPMVLVIHGGPEGMYGVDWSQEFQVLAAKGWAVFFCNPRGSTGYGEEFERGEINNWGRMDYQDIMAGVDAALKKYPWIDSGNLGVTGGSYGGYMTNWIISHNTRFKAAVTLRSISNFISDEGTRDGAYGHEEYFEGVVFDRFDQYWDASPLKYARNVRTPTLILHSDMDFRVPIEQGEQWFRALQHYGVPSELVLFPRENHNLTRTGEPKHLVESLEWQVYWFDRYLNNNPNAKAPDAQ